MVFHTYLNFIKLSNISKTFWKANTKFQHVAPIKFTHILSIIYLTAFTFRNPALLTHFLRQWFFLTRLVRTKISAYALKSSLSWAYGRICQMTDFEFLIIWHQYSCKVRGRQRQFCRALETGSSVSVPRCRITAWCDPRACTIEGFVFPTYFSVSFMPQSSSAKSDLWTALYDVGSRDC